MESDHFFIAENQQSMQKIHSQCKMISRILNVWLMKFYALINNISKVCMSTSAGFQFSLRTKRNELNQIILSVENQQKMWQINLFIDISYS